jgi:hypothetical protein
MLRSLEQRLASVAQCAMVIIDNLPLAESWQILSGVMDQWCICSHSHHQCQYVHPFSLPAMTADSRNPMPSANLLHSNSSSPTSTKSSSPMPNILSARVPSRYAFKCFSYALFKQASDSFFLISLRLSPLAGEYFLRRVRRAEDTDGVVEVTESDGDEGLLLHVGEWMEEHVDEEKDSDGGERGGESAIPPRKGKTRVGGVSGVGGDSVGDSGGDIGDSGGVNQPDDEAEEVEERGLGGDGAFGSSSS